MRHSTGNTCCVLCPLSLVRLLLRAMSTAPASSSPSDARLPCLFHALLILVTLQNLKMTTMFAFVNFYILIIESNMPCMYEIFIKINYECTWFWKQHAILSMSQYSPGKAKHGRHVKTECTKKNTLLGIWAFRKNGQWQPYRINDNFKHACTLLIKGKILWPMWSFLWSLKCACVHWHRAVATGHFAKFPDVPPIVQKWSFN